MIIYYVIENISRCNDVGLKSNPKFKMAIMIVVERNGFELIEFMRFWPLGAPKVLAGTGLTKAVNTEMQSSNKLKCIDRKT